MERLGTRFRYTLWAGLPWGIGVPLAYLFTDGTFYLLPLILCLIVGFTADGVAAWRRARARASRRG